MLECRDDKQVSDDVWRSATATAQLPKSLSEKFFASQGPTPVYFDNRRGFHRFFMRGKAVLHRGGTTLGIYTVDLSRQGIGVLSPVPLLPKECVQVQLANVKLTLEVARCKRLDERCFLCGARVVPAAEQAAVC